MLVFISLFGVYLTSILSADGAVVQDFYWRDYVAGNIPCDAFKAAPGSYIGQVNTPELNIVANFYPSTGNAVTVYAGDVLIIEDDIKIFCTTDSSNFYWEYVDFDKPEGQQLQNAVRGGYHGNTTRDPLFIGKIMHLDEWKIGKVQRFTHRNNKGIWVWDQQQKPVNLHQFHILKYNCTETVNDAPKYYWRDYEHGDVPYDAYQGAPGKCIGQIRFHLLITVVAAVNLTSGVAVTVYDNKVYTHTNITKILCATRDSIFYWEYVDIDEPWNEEVLNAVKGGYQGLYHEPVFIGKLFHEGEWKIGSVEYHGLYGSGLKIWNQNKEKIIVRKFYILKHNLADVCYKSCRSINV